MAVFTMLVGVAITASMVLAMLPWFESSIDRQRAQNAADAAALAGVTGGPAAGERLARANGGVIVSWSQDGTAVTVTVRVGERTASARATGEP